MIRCQLQLIKALSALAQAAQTHCVGGETHGAAVEIKTRLSWFFFFFFDNIFFLLDCHGFAASHKREITDSAMRPIAELILRFKKKKHCVTLHRLDQRFSKWRLLATRGRGAEI